MKKPTVPICLLLAAALFPAGVFANEAALWPWSSQNPEQPPTIKPYQLPTFHADPRHFNRAIPALEKAPRVDADGIYQQVLHCYPAPSKWNIDIKLQGALRSSSLVNIDGTTLGQNYIGIVAQMPLYSTTELDREREREYRRRTDTATVVANFVAAIAARNHAVRQLGLYSSLETRSRIRVQQGITSIDEQVKFLEKVAASQTSLIQSETAIMAARLKLVGMCQDHKANPINSYLTSLAQLPKADPDQYYVKANTQESTP